MATVSFSKEKIKQQGGVVILSLEEYTRLRDNAVPTYYLVNKEAEALDNSVKNGLRDYKLGKTKKIQSLAELR